MNRKADEILRNGLLSLLLLTLFWSAATQAGPNVSSGNFLLRQDLQRLADFGIITGPVSTWPLSWGPIIVDLERADNTELPAEILDALLRVRSIAAWETEEDNLSFNARLGGAKNAMRSRSFQDTPRGRAEMSAGMSWIGHRVSTDLTIQYVHSDVDPDEVRFDNSQISLALGNWSIGLSTQQRWWGPAWDGSLILSNNARPIPSLVIDRIFTEASESKWLRWAGPWDLSVLFGRLERERYIPNAQFFGMRFNIRPFPSLEIGLSRTAQWCGDGRPCDLETFGNLLVGRDNRGSAGISVENEPGNQLAGLDFRWNPRVWDARFGFYGQLIGEDEAGGFPSRYMGQFGIEWSDHLFDRWSTKAFLEYSATICQFHESSKLYNCAYRHTIYTTGYRYRGRSIGHSADDDAQITTLGAQLVNADETMWRALLRVGELNGGGAPDPSSTLTPTPQDIFSFDLMHSRAFRFGVFEVGIGYERIDDAVTKSSDIDSRAYLQWRSPY